MKEINQFLNEKETKKPHRVKEGEGADDQKYMALMSEYKMARRMMPGKEANKILDKAMKLGRDGDVSKNAKLAGAYL